MLRILLQRTDFHNFGSLSYVQRTATTSAIDLPHFDCPDLEDLYLQKDTFTYNNHER